MSALLSSALLSSVLQSAPDAILITDAEGQILFANRQVHALFGHEPRELLGTSVDALLPARFRERHREHRRRYAAGGGRLRAMGSGMELFALHRNGSEFPVEISLSPIQDGEKMLVAAAIRDVTAHRQAQGELLAARLAADRANSAKSRFLAMASHDLRQPLQSLGLLNGSLRRLVHDPGAIEALSQQEQAIASMARLLNALLDISKLESGAIRADAQDFELAPLLQALQREFTPLAQAKNLQLHLVAPQCSVRSDPALVGQVLRNLLANAIKYTRAGHVQIRATLGAEGVCIEIEDTGVGIAPENLGAIYDEFFQIGSPGGAAREGYGLGLSIVKRLTDLLGVQLSVRSRLGQGSVFGVTIPHARGPAASAVRQAPAPAPAPLRKARILLVEDDPGVRDATRLLLKVEGYAVVAAATRDEALTQVASGGPIDLVISDFHLGGECSAPELIGALRAQLPTPFHTIVITGDTSTAQRELPQDPSLHLLGKPVHADELLKLVRDLL